MVSNVTLLSQLSKFENDRTINLTKKLLRARIRARLGIILRIARYNIVLVLYKFQSCKYMDIKDDYTTISSTGNSHKCATIDFKETSVEYESEEHMRGNSGTSPRCNYPEQP